MKKLAAVALAVVAGTALAQELQPGEWEFTTTMNMPQMPKPQTSTITRCVKKEDANPEKWASKGGPQTDCKVATGAKTANSVSWTISCPQSGMRGEGSARISGGTMESSMTMSGDMGGQSFNMTTKTTGRRLGPCK